MILLNALIHNFYLDQPIKKILLINQSPSTLQMSQVTTLQPSLKKKLWNDAKWFISGAASGMANTLGKRLHHVLTFSSGTPF